MFADVFVKWVTWDSTNLCVLLWLQLAGDVPPTMLLVNEQRALFSLRRWCIHRGHSAYEKDEKRIPWVITMKLLLLTLLTVTSTHGTGSSQDFQVYGHSVIGLDGTVEKSLAAVIRVPREQPTNEMPNDEPDTSPPSSGRPIFIQRFWKSLIAFVHFHSLNRPTTSTANQKCIPLLLLCKNAIATFAL